MYASFAVRIPAVKEQVGASSAALRLALLGLSAGAVATMLLAGALCRRFGSPRMTVISCALLSASLVLPALARSVITLGLLLAVFGAAYGCLNVAMNSVAVDMVAALRRPVMPGFHAAWSFGGLAGAGLGGLLAPHLSPVRHLFLIARAGLLAGSGGVALTSTLGYSGFLLGPPAIGFLASDFGLRAGLTTLSFLALSAAVIAYLCQDVDS